MGVPDMAVSLYPNYAAGSMLRMNSLPHHIEEVGQFCQKYGAAVDLQCGLFTGCDVWQELVVKMVCGKRKSKMWRTNCCSMSFVQFFT